MPRSGADARRRLQQAALELFQERGYDATTAAGIAAKAGVTERTFFRHFADKREVLFDGEDAFRQALAHGVQHAPEHLAPMQALLWTFRSVAPLLEQNRSFSEPRRHLIARTPPLQERLSAKTAGLVKALADALGCRGVDEALAMLAAEMGMALFSYAANRWLDDPSEGVEAHLSSSYAAMQCLLSET